MAKVIITQEGAILNFNSLFSITVEPVEIEDENGFTTNEYGLVAYDKNGSDTLMFHSESIETVIEERQRLIGWLQQEAYSTFNLLGGDA